MACSTLCACVHPDVPHLKIPTLCRAGLPVKKIFTVVWVMVLAVSALGLGFGVLGFGFRESVWAVLVLVLLLGGGGRAVAPTWALFSPLHEELVLEGPLHLHYFAWPVVTTFAVLRCCPAILLAPVLPFLQVVLLP